MNLKLDGGNDMHARILKLERQNHRIKQIGVTALIVIGSLLVMGEARSRKSVEANEFVLLDNGGNVGANLALNKKFGNPEMHFFDEKGKTMLSLAGGGPSDNWGGSMILFDGQGRDRAIFQANLDKPSLTMSNSKGDIQAGLGPGFLDVSDGEGFQAALGTMGLETPSTGETRRTSAASLVLLDKDKKVIWKAP